MIQRVPNARTCIPCYLLGALTVLAMGCAPRTDSGEVAAAAIRTLLERQVEAWNAGDVRGFMEGYMQSDSLRFASAGSVRYGWEATFERYLSTYPDGDAMGRLTFSDLDIDVLSEDWALVFGAWHLEREGNYESIGGLFTLALVRTEAGWRIIFDHTSSAS